MNTPALNSAFNAFKAVKKTLTRPKDVLIIRYFFVYFTIVFR